MRCAAACRAAAGVLVFFHASFAHADVADFVGKPVQSIRLAIEEQTHERQLPAVAAFCQVGGQMLIDQGRAYLDAASKDSEGLLLGRLHNAQEQRDRFELFLRRRFETEALTRPPSETSVDELADDEI